MVMVVVGLAFPESVPVMTGWSESSQPAAKSVAAIAQLRRIVRVEIVMANAELSGERRDATNIFARLDPFSRGREYDD